MPLVEKSDEYQREGNFIIPVALPDKRERNAEADIPFQWFRLKDV